MKSDHKLSRVLSVALAPILGVVLATAPVLPAMASSAAQAIESEARLEAILKIAEQAATENSKDADRLRLVNEIQQLMSTLGPVETLEIVKGLLIRLETFQSYADRRSNEQMEHATLMAAIVVISLFGITGDNQKVLPLAIAVAFSATALACVKLYESDKIAGKSRDNIGKLRAQLSSLKSELQTRIAAEKLK